MSLVEKYKNLEKGISEGIAKGESNLKILFVFGRYNILLLNINMSGYTPEEIEEGEVDEKLLTNVILKKIKKEKSINSECDYEKNCVFHGVKYETENETKMMCTKECPVAKYLDFENEVFKKWEEDGLSEKELGELFDEFDEFENNLYDEKGDYIKQRPYVPNIKDRVKIVTTLSEYEMNEDFDDKEIGSFNGMYPVSKDYWGRECA